MARRGVDRGSDNVLRDLVLVVESEPDVDPDALDRSVRQLRAELKDLDVESVTPLTLENAPPGAKGVDPSSLGDLLITLPASGGVFTVLIETVRDWLARQAAARSISVTIDGDTLVLEKSSAQERTALIDAYLRRHEVN
jgi:Effector Associated Constant Component 1